MSDLKCLQDKRVGDIYQEAGNLVSKQVKLDILEW